MLSQKLSIESKILKFLFEPKYKYKGMSVSILGLPAIFPYKKQSINNALYRLNKSGYISKKNSIILLSQNGRKYVENKKVRLVTFDSPFQKAAPKNLLVMFDIPETKKAEREWFRYHLKEFNYEMIQRSVWVGPSPLPKDFLDYINEIKLKECIKTFKLAKSYNI
ncbi:CRISPR-associated endonuclease Cas2 [Candidatus Nomurabacteria bacterium CG_4_10_14_0_2_um_filter_30_12]|uniref:CRISPR-associated endonuclease Cas2 n=2 Tax=Candidatus Nomuraibacteriota TaxID=1752729 RepID=A0A1J4UYQ5_9BACT|nr:MAG: CRISPR-associated endonuclease Cas2 [Candidatus Nomurabacteria bacterium CG1_02_31_12]PIZ87077.1 MAG: CRISPR-associated endonuclease Cas2 [Candidatus Nomurabacteria bacterium CG_4_10_14_0_2_um_filter_30_12]